MQIQVNTDNHIQGTEQLASQVESEVEDALRRFADRITRVEVHLSDVNSGAKSRPGDKRCVMEARPTGLQPIVVSHEASSLDQAVSGAADKLEKALSRTLDRLQDPRGRTSFGGEHGEQTL